MAVTILITLKPITKGAISPVNRDVKNITTDKRKKTNDANFDISLNL